MKKFFLLMLSVFAFCAADAQVTTSGMNGTVTDADGQPLAGATVIAVHTPSGTQYGAVSDKNGGYNLQGLRTGGPYTVTFSFVGCQSVEFPGLMLSLGQTLKRDAFLKDSQQLEAVVITADGKNSSMNVNRAGAVTSISNEQIELMPTVNRSMNDIMRLTPQASSTTSGLAIGGGNYRQSYVTVDGAAFNNMFGIGGNLPAGGSPISLDALEQVSVSITPFDVRQSGFTGGAINAVTKSGTNDLKVSAYLYSKSDQLQGDKYDGGKLSLSEMRNNTLGFSVGAPIVRNKLFVFANFEREWNTTPGNSRLARTSESQDFGKALQYNRPTTAKLDEMSRFLIDNYGYNPGAYQNYSVKTPGYKLMARVDWNINRNHALNVRFSRTQNKYSSAPSSSISPLNAGKVYDKDVYGRTSVYAMYFGNSRYYQEQNFTSVAAELNSRFMDSRLTNTLRYTYSHQYEPRSYDGGIFPTVDILEPAENGASALYASFGLDPFTEGNLREVSTHILTDEIGYTLGKHRLVAGLQFEHNLTTNGYLQGGAGYYVYESWDDFKNDKAPLAFRIAHGNNDDLSQAFPQFSHMQYSVYLQDEINVSERFKATVGVRFEVPVYPSISGNENKDFTEIFAEEHPELAEKEGNKLSGDTSLSREDSFVRNYRSSKPSGFNKEKAYLIKEDKLPAGEFGVMHGRMPVSQLKKVAHGYHASLNEYFIAVFVWSVYKELLHGMPGGKPIRIAVPVNLRPYFDSDTTKNFFVMVSAEFRPQKESYTFEEVLACIQSSLHSQINKEHLEDLFSYSVSNQRNLLMRPVPLFLKNIAMRYVYTSAALANTSTVTNIGNVKVEEDYQPYIKMFYAFLAMSKGQNIKGTICSYQDTLAFTFSSVLKDTSLQRGFFRKLSEDGLNVEIESNGVYYE